MIDLKGHRGTNEAPVIRLIVEEVDHFLGKPFNCTGRRGGGF